MSRTIKGSKPMGYDFWSKRPHSKCGYGPVIKQMTHRTERNINKSIIKSELKNHHED